MNKTANTWALMKASWQVLMRDKALLLFPVVSGIACFLVLLTFLVPAIGLSGSGMGGIERGYGGVGGYVLLFCYYLCNFFVVFFFNAALVDYVMTRLSGGEPTIGASLRAATACLPQIAAWAVIASTVGVILKALESRAGFLGRIVIALVGVAWALVTYFVVPLIVIERKGAVAALGDSRDLLARTWGKQIVSGLGYGLIGFLLTVPAIIVIALAIFGIATSGGQHVGGFGSLAVLAVLYLIGLVIVLSALRAIFGVVLYRFATTGDTPEGFDAAQLRGAIQPS
ncbi:MAG: DUF6159 family protein [Betaproteobacteria bacterium]